MTHVAVVGSGPAGVFCAKALRARGVRVTILDAGERLDPERQRVVDALAARPPSEWAAEDVAAIAGNPTVASQAIPTKLAFGSPYVYGRDRPFAPLDSAPGGPAPTYAQGGFSTVWGGAMLPAANVDLGAWPFDSDRLEPHYRAVLRDVPLCARDDGLTAAFPLHGEPKELAPPPQAEALLADLGGAREALAREGAVAGRARLAVHAAGRHACVRCGLCLSGCPVGAIYGTVEGLANLQRDPAVEYRSGRVVTAVDQDEHGVRIDFAPIAGTAPNSEHFTHVFLAAGALNSTRILLQSRRDFDRPLPLLDSQKVLVPMLRLRRVRGAAVAAGNVLAAAFVEVLDPRVSPHWIHLQISPISRLVLQRLGAANPDGLRARLGGPLLDRIMTVWGGVHSDHSGSVEVRLRNDRGPLSVRVLARPETSAVLRGVRAKVARLAPLFGARALTPFAQAAPIGGGGHVGGSLPMRESPGQWQTDVYGRPGGRGRMFVVDAAVFPSLPATTIALTIMANAHRIGAEAPLD